MTNDGNGPGGPAQFSRIEHARTFSELLLPEPAPGGHAALLWSLPAKRNRWPTTAEQLAGEALVVDSEGQDVYVGVCLREPKGVTSGRGGSEGCTYALGVVLDLDIESPGQAPTLKPRFKSREAALSALAAAFRLPPTFIIDSGGGLHVWWLYREPFDLSVPADRVLAARVAQAWNARMVHVANGMGVSVDSVYDLARVLRVPGTTNRKIHGVDRPVLLLAANATARYNLSELADELGHEAMTAIAEPATSRGVVLGRLRLDPTANPPSDKMFALAANHERFAALWRRDPITDKWLRDSSASGYDLALANICVRAGWSDQEIADMMIANRREHGDDLKLRENYYARTIALAREGLDGTAKAAKQRQVAVEESAAHAIEEAATLDDPNEKRAEVLLLLSKATGVDVRKISSNGKDPARYRVLVGTDGEVLHVKSTRLLIEQDTWLCLALETNAKVPVEPLSGKNWRKLVAQVAQVLEFEPDSDSLSDLVAEYVSTAPDVDAQSAKGARAGLLSGGRPVRLADGTPALHLASFMRWLADAGRKVESADLKARLRALGWRTKVLAYAIGGAQTSRMYWAAPTSAEGDFARQTGTSRGLRLIRDDEPMEQMDLDDDAAGNGA